MPTDPWARLDLMRREHARAQARVRCAEQLAHLGSDRARELELAQEDERQHAAQVARLEAEVEALRLEAVERARVVPPDRGDRAVLEVLDKLARKASPECWEKGLRESSDPVDRRALRHFAWLRQLQRGGGTVEEWRRSQV